MFIEEVDSSCIKSVACDQEEGKMWLRFKSGDLYEYQGVDLQVAKDLAEAESVGKYFQENIKNKYECNKVG